MATVSETVAAADKIRPAPKRSFGQLSAWLWVAPAILFTLIFLVYPVITTIIQSFQNDTSTAFVGLKNFQRIFTDPNMLEVLRNNILWLIIGTVGTVFLGLVIAVLVDRVKIESIAKSAIFIPMAISFVGAGVIWRFVYLFAPKGTTQTGLLNAFLTRIGLDPQPWLTNPATVNFAMMAVYIWMWTGFCMVILSAALKAVPTDIIEAARVDGASELTIFWRVIVPVIRPTIIVVATTMVINLLKIFDIIYVMSGGNYGSNVIAFAYYQQDFIFDNTGLASALAVVLLLAIIPVMYFNIRQYRSEVKR